MMLKKHIRHHLARKKSEEEGDGTVDRKSPLHV